LVNHRLQKDECPKNCAQKGHFSRGLYIEESIDAIESIVMKFRKDRNDIAHNCGYKNNNVFVLVTVNNFDLEGYDMQGADQYLIDEAVGLLHPVIDELNIAITNLISSLSFLYKRVLEHKGNNT
jgi:hypothetical protein